MLPITPNRDTLAIRVTPRQKRAEDTVERILTIAAALLDELGLDAFNTNLLAERADIRVRTVYRYFPNKFSVLAEIARRNSNYAMAGIDGFAPLSDPAIPLKQGLDILWGNYFTQLNQIPAFEPIRHALRIYPELQNLQKEIQPVFAKQLASALKKRGIKLPTARLNIIATVVIESSNALMDYAAFENNARQKALISELQAMQLFYLTPIFEEHS